MNGATERIEVQPSGFRRWELFSRWGQTFLLALSEVKGVCLASLGKAQGLALPH
ncbi:MAG: hypothetical protein ACE5HB_09580 [Terriglobia bacterium]